MPREVRVLSPGQAGIVEYELPLLEEGQVRVRSEFGSAKHGTEMAFYKGYGSKRGRFDRELGAFVKTDDPPGPFSSMGTGNMFVGEVTEVGAGVKKFKPGDRVLGYGGFREVHTTPAERCRLMPDGLSWKSAVCLDPADFATAAVRDGNVRFGDVVAIFGMGAIGLMAVQIAKLSGAALVIAVEPLENRRVAAEKCGADIVLDPTGCDAGLEIRLATDKRGADVTIEYSGSQKALQAAIRGIAYGGNVVAGAFPPPYGAGLDFGSEAHLNIPNIIFSRACSEPNREHPRWDEKRIYATCWAEICAGRLSGEAIVAPVVPFEQLPEEYIKIATNPETNIKLGATF